MLSFKSRGMLLLAIVLIGVGTGASAEDWLDPAVEDTKQVFVDHGLPAAWLPLGEFDPGKVDPVFVMGAWEMIREDVERKFQGRYGTKHKPASLLICDDPREYSFEDGTRTHIVRKSRVRFSIANKAFEETVLRAFWGPEHEHSQFRSLAAPKAEPLPNIRRKYLLADGAVNFDLIRNDFAKLLESRFNLSNDKEASKTTSSDCWVIADWQKPDRESLGWVRKQFAWRPVFEVGFTEGHRSVPGLDIDGGKRLVIDAYISVGFRSDEREPFKPVFRAGPYQETAYKPVGHGVVHKGGWSVRYRTVPCMAVPRDALANLNTGQTTYETTRDRKQFLWGVNASLFREKLREYHDALDASLKVGKLQQHQSWWQGDWQASAIKVRGQDLPQEMVNQSGLTIVGDSFQMNIAGRKMQYTFKLNPDSDPLQFDLIKDQAGNKVTMPGIYFWNGDQVALCWVEPGMKRPTEMQIDPGSQAVYFEWKRKAK